MQRVLSSSNPLPLVCALAAWLALGLPASAQDAAAGPPETRRIDVFYTGFTGGLSSGRVDFAELRPLFKPDVPRGFEVGGFVGDNAFRHGDLMIYTDAGPLTLDDFQAFFAAGPIHQQALGPCKILASDYAYVLAPVAPADGPDAAWPTDWLLDGLRKLGGFTDAHHAPAHRYQLTNADGVHLYVLALGDAAPAADAWNDPTRWEMLPAGTVRVRRDGHPTGLLAVGRPLGDGLRRSRLLMGLRKETSAPSLTVDAGNLLDPGFTQLSRDQREFTLLRLRELAYDAVVPAETELALSPADWDRLRALVPIIAANLRPRDAARAPLPAHLVKKLGGLSVALVGLVDDHALDLHGSTGPSHDWIATDAVAAARAEVEALAPEAPDAILLVTNVRDQRLEELRQLTGVTAVLGDFHGLPGDVYTEQVDVSGPLRARSLSTYMVAKASPNRVGHFSGLYDVRPGMRPEMRALRNDAHLVTDVLPEDEGWRWQLNVTLDRYQSARRGLLLPDLRDAAAAVPAAKLLEPGALPAFDRSHWTRLVANVLREATGAEVAVTQELPVTRTLIGPVSQLALENWLDVGDHVVSLTLPGKTLRLLAAADDGAHLLTFSGFDPASGKVMGFKLDDDERYRVTLTDAVVRHTLFHALFDAVPLDERWQLDAGAARPTDHGAPLLLRELVLSALQALKAAHGDAFTPAYLEAYAKLLAPTGEDVEPRWLFQLDDGQLLLNGYQNRGNQGYDQVRNTRVTTPDSFALGGKGKLAATYDSRDWAWENRAKATYKRNTLHQNGVDVSQKQDDEIVLTSELRLAFLHPAAIAGLSPTPFVNTSYTTQFQPDDPVDGVPKPRRAELNASGGLVVYPGLGFKEIRLGGVIQDDLARPGYLDPGAQLSLSFERKLETVPLTLKAGLDATHFLPTPTDGPDRLGWLIDATAGISVPLWERFTLNLGADYFAYQGKVPQTSGWGSSLDFKIGLGYSLAFKPLYGVWF